MLKKKNPTAGSESGPNFGENNTPLQDWEDFVRAKQAKAGAQGMREAHHPDCHYLGADANSCPKCDEKLPSLKDQYEAA